LLSTLYRSCYRLGTNLTISHGKKNLSELARAVFILI